MRSLYVLVFAQIISLAFTKVLEEDNKGPCHVQDSNLDHCILKKIKSSYPNMLKGIPELSFPKLHPLEIPTFEVKNEMGNIFMIDAKLKNVRIYGFDGIIVEQATFDPKDLIFTIKLFFPLAQAELEYDITGHIFSLPLENKGLMTGNWTDTTFDAIVSLGTVTRNGVNYFKIKDMAVESRVGNGVAKLLSKNPNFQPAANIIMDFYNNNPRLFMDTVNPTYVKASEEFLTAFFNPILAKLPISDVLSA